MRRPMLIEPVPHETARVARAAWPKGPRDRRLADALDALFRDDAFLALFPTPGPPARPPWRLALVTLLPGADGLAARHAAHAGRRRCPVNLRGYALAVLVCAQDDQNVGKSQRPSTSCAPSGVHCTLGYPFTRHAG
jgi:hypothetical protein